MCDSYVTGCFWDACYYHVLQPSWPNDCHNICSVNKRDFYVIQMRVEPHPITWHSAQTPPLLLLSHLSKELHYLISTFCAKRVNSSCVMLLHFASHPVQVCFRISLCLNNHAHKNMPDDKVWNLACKQLFHLK